ncbi:MAG: hypothetical protein HKP25_08850, partial [Marinicaulis sp.]|nr:hypothetical protein [Marinicaulis sp.]
MRRRILTASIFALTIAAAGCGKKEGSNAPDELEVAGVEHEAVFSAPAETPRDEFTYANYQDVRVTHVDLELTLNFDEKVIDGVATLSLEYLNTNAIKVVLDTNDLDIISVEARDNGDYISAAYRLGQDDPVTGASLEIDLPDQADSVRVTYRTS